MPDYTILTAPSWSPVQIRDVLIDDRYCRIHGVLTDDIIINPDGSSERKMVHATLMHPDYPGRGCWELWVLTVADSGDPFTVSESSGGQADAA